MSKYEAIEYLRAEIAESNNNYLLASNNLDIDILMDGCRKRIMLKELLISNDLGIDGYVLQRVKKGIVTTYSLYCNGWVTAVTMEIDGKVVGHDVIELFLEIIKDNVDNIRLLSRHEKSRRNRHNRANFEIWKDKKVCEYLDNIDHEEDYKTSFTKSAEVAEILPNYTIYLRDVIGDEIELFK